MGLTYHPLALSLCGGTMAIFYPCTMNFISELFPKQFEKVTITALLFMGLMLISMHWGMGFLADGLGITRAMYLGPLFMLVVIALLALFQVNRKEIKN